MGRVSTARSTRMYINICRLCISSASNSLISRWTCPRTPYLCRLTSHLLERILSTTVGVICAHGARVSFNDMQEGATYSYSLNLAGYETVLFGICVYAIMTIPHCLEFQAPSSKMLPTCKPNKILFAAICALPNRKQGARKLHLFRVDRDCKYD